MWNDSFGTRQLDEFKRLKSRYVGKHLEAHTRMWPVSIKSHPSWAKYLATWEAPSSQLGLWRPGSPTSWWGARSTRRAPASCSPAPPSSSSASSSSAASTTAGWGGTWERPTDGQSSLLLQTQTPPQTPCTLPETQIKRGVTWWYIFPSPNFIAQPESVAVLSSPSSQENSVSPKLCFLSSNFCRSHLNIEFYQETTLSTIWG